MKREKRYLPQTVCRNLFRLCAGVVKKISFNSVHIKPDSGFSRVNTFHKLKDFLIVEISFYKVLTILISQYGKILEPSRSSFN